MKIRYGVNRRRPNGKGKRDIEYKNNVMELIGVEWEDKNAHQKIKEAIYKNYPGWSIRGYCLASEVMANLTEKGFVWSLNEEC